MLANTNDFPLGPPPIYEMAQDVNSCHDPQKKDISETSNKTTDNVEFDDPPPYKEKESPTHTVNSFQFLFPLITRPWKRFFSLCWRNQWSISAENFGHNMTYYQLNYIWLLLILVVVSLVMWVFFIDCKHSLFCLKIGGRNAEQVSMWVWLWTWFFLVFFFLWIFKQKRDCW